MFIVPVYIDKSPIHGIGLFAKEAIKQGTEIWRFHPRLDLKFSPAEWDELPTQIREALNEHAWQPEENGPIYYEATAGKYINHSNAPNTDFKTEGVGFAKHDIAAGEELTTDYREFSWNHALIPFIGNEQ